MYHECSVFFFIAKAFYLWRSDWKIQKIIIKLWRWIGVVGVVRSNNLVESVERECTAYFFLSVKFKFFFFGFHKRRRWPDAATWLVLYAQEDCLYVCAVLYRNFAFQLMESLFSTLIFISMYASDTHTIDW